MTKSCPFIGREPRKIQGKVGDPPQWIWWLKIKLVQAFLSANQMLAFIHMALGKGPKSRITSDNFE